MNEGVCRFINGVNSKMVSRITGQSIREEAKVGTRTLDLVRIIRARRFKWVGHILRMGDNRLVKQGLQQTYENRQEGDILMDVQPTSSWEELVRLAADRKQWRDRARTIRESNISKWHRMSRLIRWSREFNNNNNNTR